LKPQIGSQIWETYTFRCILRELGKLSERISKLPPKGALVSRNSRRINHGSTKDDQIFTSKETSQIAGVTGYK
jgi:hypothetical protein